MNILRTIKKSVIRELRPASMLQPRSTRPVSDTYGFDRGQPIDRYYIDRFFAAFASDIRGDVLEIQDQIYARKFGRALSSCNVLDIAPENEVATITADLANADDIPSGSFDCFILPQTLQFIYDFEGAIYHAHRILRPNGVLLATVPALARVDSELFTSDFWRFTPRSCERLFGKHFGSDGLAVSSFGNALSCSAFINGMSVEEFSASELDPVDSFFPLIVTVRAQKKAVPPS